MAGRWIKLFPCENCKKKVLHISLVNSKLNVLSLSLYLLPLNRNLDLILYGYTSYLTWLWVVIAFSLFSLVCFSNQRLGGFAHHDVVQCLRSVDVLELAVNLLSNIQVSFSCFFLLEINLIVVSFPFGRQNHTYRQQRMSMYILIWVSDTNQTWKWHTIQPPNHLE